MTEMVIYGDDMEVEKIIQIVGTEMVIFNSDYEVEKIAQVKDNA